jgi:uncharacterized membrane protein
MNAGNLLRSKLLGLACAAAFASSAALAQTAQDANTAAPAASASTAPADAATKSKGQQSEKKQQQPAKAAEAKPRAGQYATEAEARSHCRSTVVWIDKDNFNHYAGSREYGKKPGAFGCEG